MVEDRLESIEEELEEVAELPELKAIWCHWQAEWPDVANHPTCAVLIKQAVRRVKLATPVQPEMSSKEQLKDLLTAVIAQTQASAQTAAQAAAQQQVAPVAQSFEEQQARLQAQEAQQVANAANLAALYFLPQINGFLQRSLHVQMLK